MKALANRWRRLSLCLVLFCIYSVAFAQQSLDALMDSALTLMGKPELEYALKNVEQKAHVQENREMECRAWNELADFYYSNENEEALFSVYDTLTTLVNVYSIPKYYYNVSSTKSLFLLRQHRIDEAYEICLNAREKAMSDQDDEGLYVSYIMMARFFNTNKMNELAIKECEQAIEMERKLPDHTFGTSLALALNCSQESESWKKGQELIDKYGHLMTAPKYQMVLLAKQIIIDFWTRKFSNMEAKKAELKRMMAKYDLQLKADDKRVMELIDLIQNKQYKEAQVKARTIDIPLRFSFQSHIFYDLNMPDSLFMVVQHRNEFYNSREEALFNSDARKVQLEKTIDNLTVRNEQLKETTYYLQNRQNHIILLAIMAVLAMGLLAAAVYIWVNRKYTKDLQARNAQVEKANNFKTQFVQNMSHEVRTPLNAICGFSQLLADPQMSEMLSQEEKQQYSDIINSSTDMLTSLVNDILDIGDIESGKYRIYVQDVDVNLVCRKSLNTVEHRVMGKDVELIFESHLPQGFCIQSDPARIQQILVNYLTNAIKHTDEGSIVLSVQPLEGMRVRFSVTDTGEGVDPVNAEAIFQRFEKLNTFKQGTGLGLPICRSLATCMDGKAYLDTSYKLGGARFNLDL